MKHTAANTDMLALIKKIFNGKIYKKALGIYNSDGELAMLGYLQQYFINDIRQVLLQDWS